MYAGKPKLRLPLNTCNQALIHEECSPSPVQTPRSGSSSQNTLTCSPSLQSDTFHWPDVQELRTKYTSHPSHPSKVTCSCTAQNGVPKCCTNGCNGCSNKYNSSSDLHKALTECPRTQSETVYKEQCPVVEDWPQPQLQPLLCRWSSLDHMLGSLPLHEVQNLQEPVRTCYTGSQVSLITRETGKLQDEDKVLQEGSDYATKSASLKLSESNLVKSLREKFQSLSTSSWIMYIFIIRDYHMERLSACYLMLLNVPFSCFPQKNSTCVHIVFSIGDTVIRKKLDYWLLVRAMRGQHIAFKKVYCNICTLGIFLHCTIHVHVKICMYTVACINWRFYFIMICIYLVPSHSGWFLL